jgi:hypothetical protein
VHRQRRLLLESAGYGEAEHNEALALLTATCAYGKGGLDPLADERSRNAASEVAHWVRTHFPRFLVALERLHPEFASLFPVVPGRDDARAVLDLRTALERVAALAARVPTPGVVRMLRARGLTPREHARLMELVVLAQSASLPTETPDDDMQNALVDMHTERDRALEKLLAWRRDWSATARAVIRRKDWLISMGLAERGR